MSGKTKTNESILLLGFPGSGLIGTFAVSYIIQFLKMPQIGEIDHPDLPPTLFVDNGEIFGPIRIHKKNNLFAIISDLPFGEDLGYGFAESIIAFCKHNKIKNVIIPSGMDSPNRNPNAPKVYGLVTHPMLDSLLYQNDIPKFLSGTIMGSDAAIVSTFRKSKTPAVVLYTECHPFFPDPEASLSAITIVSKILKIKVDTTDIKKRLDHLRIQHRKLMQETINAIQSGQQEKSPTGKIPHIYR